MLTTTSSGLLRAQDNNRHLGMEFSYVNPNIFKDGFAPGITWAVNKHQISAGWLLMYDQRSYRPMHGAYAGYRIYPNGSVNKLSLFFDYTFNFVKGGIDDRYISRGWPYSSGDRHINVVSLDNYLGFGFQWNIFKSIYLHTGVAMNIGFYKEEYRYEYESGLTYEEKGTLRFREMDGLNFQVKTGLGFRLALPKKSRPADK